MKQVIQIDLVSANSTAYDNYAEIKRAIENASLGLYSKYDVQIKDVQTIHKKVIMHLTIPDEMAENFSIGHHFRGVSAFLLKNYKEKYSPLIVGKRLLTYTVIPTPTDHDDSNFTFNEKLSAITKFSELLKYEDEASKEKIAQIIDILNQED